MNAPLWALGAFVAVLLPLVAFGVTVGYHRVLTHRAARLHPVVERVLVTIGLPAGTPVQWIGNHRRHHAVADTPADVHAPGHVGFWIAHCGWYLETKSVPLSIAYALAGPLRTLFDAWWRPRTNQQWVHLAPDVAAVPYYARLSTPRGYAIAMLSYVAVLWIPVVALWGAVGAATLWIVHLLAYTFGDLVNSAGHGPGGKTFAVDDDSRDLGWLAVLAFGDGFHNGHHAFPWSARSGFARFPLDWSWVFLRALERVGLATDVRVPTEVQRAARRAGAPVDVQARRSAA